MQLTVALMKKIYPKANTNNIVTHLDHINKALDWYQINNYRRVAAFMAVCGNETGQLNAFSEVGSASYLAKYDGRKDLGNTQPGDGARFKGRGAIQLTGRANYTLAAKDFGIDFVNNPDLVATPQYAWLVSGWYWAVLWKRYNVDLNAYADKEDLLTIQKRVNGGMIGWENRKALYDAMLPILRQEMGGQVITQKKKSLTTS